MLSWQLVVAGASEDMTMGPSSQTLSGHQETLLLPQTGEVSLVPAGDFHPAARRGEPPGLCPELNETKVT